MDKLFLAELFYLDQEHIINSEIQEALNNCTEDEAKLLSSISESDKSLVKIYKTALINAFENVRLIHYCRAISFGIKIGLALQGIIS